MTTDQAAAFAVLAGALVLFVWGRVRYDLVALLALLASVLAGIVPAERAFSGFANPATVTVLLVLVLGRALSATGAVEMLTGRIVRAVRSDSLHVATMSGLGAALSTLMNNVAALALLLPVALDTSAKARRSPAVVLMPLSFACILGGLVTLIGTPPNIIVSAYRESVAGEPFTMLDFTPVGAVVAVVGVLFVALVGWRLLPAEGRERRGTGELIPIDDYIAEVRVPEGSGVEGELLSDLDKRAEEVDASLVALIRGGGRWVAQAGRQTLRPGDVVVVEASPEALDRFAAATGLELVGAGDAQHSALRSETTTTGEAVVRADSRLVGRSPERLRLRSRYGVSLLGVSRGGRPIRERLRRFTFRAGDVVLLQGDTRRLQGVMHRLGCLPLASRGVRVGARSRRWLALGVFAGAIVAATAGWLPLAVALLLAVVATVLGGALTTREAYGAVEWPVVVLLGAMIPVGGALETTGATHLVAEALLWAASSPPVALTLLLVVAMTLSDVMNNAATAVVLAPIAAAVADELHVAADPFLMAVAVGASCAFLTPVGHQNNTLVLGPGGYRFGDYWRMGLPLEMLIVAVAVPLILIVWPL